MQIVEGLAGDWRRLDGRVEILSDEVEAIARQDAGCERLMSVPGIGQIIPARWWLRLAPGMCSPRVATLPPGSGSFPSFPDRSSSDLELV